MKNGKRPMSASRLAILLACVAIAGCLSSRNSVYYDGPVHRSKVEADNGWRECGLLVDGLPEGHWIEYKAEEDGGIWIRWSGFYRAGKAVGLAVLLSRKGRVEDLIAFDLGGEKKEQGFGVSWNAGSGVLKSLHFVSGGEVEGWMYQFEAGTKTLYEGNQPIKRVALDPEVGDGQDLNVFRGLPTATDRRDKR